MSDANSLADCYGSQHFTDFSDEKKMLKDAHFDSIRSSQLQDKPHCISSALQGVSMSCDNMLLGSQMYRESGKNKPALARANRSMDDVLPFRRYGEPFQPPKGISHGLNERAKLLGQSYRSTYHQYSITQTPSSKHFFTIAQAATSAGCYSNAGTLITDIDSPASSHFTQNGRSENMKAIIPTAWSKDIPEAILCAVPQTHRHTVKDFLADYIGTSHNLPPSALLVIDVDTPDIKGSVITTLCSTDRFAYGFRGPDDLVYTGESVLVPELHDPKAFIACLLNRSMINDLSAIQPAQPLSIHSQFLANFSSKLPGTQRPFKSNKNHISTSIIDEARLFALQNLRNPSMVKFPVKRNELVWCGWNLILNPDESYSHSESTNVYCSRSFCIPLQGISKNREWFEPKQKVQKHEQELCEPNSKCCLQHWALQQEWYRQDDSVIRDHSTITVNPIYAGLAQIIDLPGYGLFEIKPSAKNVSRGISNA